MRLFSTPFAVVVLLGILAGGCSRVSPAVGTWSLDAGNSSAALELREDGTGTLRMAVLPEQPVSWTEEDGTVTLRFGGGTETGGSGAAPKTRPGVGTALTGALSEDKKSMTIAFGPTTLTLQKQAE